MLPISFGGPLLQTIGVLAIHLAIDATMRGSSATEFESDVFLADLSFLEIAK